MKVEVNVGPILPETALNPSPWVQPIWPPTPMLHGQLCAFCGQALWLGAPIQATDKGLAHAGCGGEAFDGQAGARRTPEGRFRPP